MFPKYSAKLLRGGFDLVTQSITSGVKAAKPRRALALFPSPLWLIAGGWTVSQSGVGRRGREKEMAPPAAAKNNNI